MPASSSSKPVLTGFPGAAAAAGSGLAKKGTEFDAGMSVEVETAGLRSLSRMLGTLYRGFRWCPGGWLRSTDDLEVTSPPADDRCVARVMD